MGPPCTAFSNWSHLNRVTNYETWKRSHVKGKVLADFAAEIALLQLQYNRHFIIENPAGSEIFSLPSFKRLYDTKCIAAINFPQCALGLRVHGDLIYKYTTLWTSPPILVEPFIGLKCTHGHQHGKLEGGNKTKLAQVWPHAMCARSIQGTINLIKVSRTRKTV